MIGFSFGRWNHAAGRAFIKDRIRIKGYIWTPFVRMRRRYEGVRRRWACDYNKNRSPQWFIRIPFVVTAMRWSDRYAWPKLSLPANCLFSVHFWHWEFIFFPEYL